MKKFALTILSIVLAAMLTLTLVGCSPKHNERATIELSKTITLDNSREQVIDIIGEPLAFDATEDEFNIHGYDLLIYSPDDIEILEWYKKRTKKGNNLPGFTSHISWSNKEWERKYYTGNTASQMPSITYSVIMIKFLNKIIESVECWQYTKNTSGRVSLYSLLRNPKEIDSITPTGWNSDIITTE